MDESLFRRGGGRGSTSLADSASGLSREWDRGEGVGVRGYRSTPRGNGKGGNNADRGTKRNQIVVLEGGLLDRRPANC